MTFFWTRIQGDRDGSCLSSSVTTGSLYAYSAVTCLNDWVFALLPWLMVRKLQMDRGTKIMVACVLAVASMWVGYFGKILLTWLVHQQQQLFEFHTFLAMAMKRIFYTLSLRSHCGLALRLGWVLVLHLVQHWDHWYEHGFHPLPAPHEDIQALISLREGVNPDMSDVHRLSQSIVKMVNLMNGPSTWACTNMQTLFMWGTWGYDMKLWVMYINEC